MPTVLQLCYNYHTILTRFLTEAVALEMAAELGVDIIYEPDGPEDADTEINEIVGKYLRWYRVRDSDLVMFIGFDSYRHLACGRLHTQASIEYSDACIDAYINSRYCAVERIVERSGEILGVFARPPSDLPYHNQ